MSERREYTNFKEAMASNGIPASKVSSSTADFDILYERIRVRAVQTSSCTCNQTGSEYPEYVADELALFYKLQSELTKKKDKVPFPSAGGEDLEIDISAEDVPKNVPVPDEDSDSMDCEVLWVGTAEASEPEPKPPVEKLDVNGNLDAAVDQNETQEDLGPISTPMEQPEPDPVSDIPSLPKKSKSSKESKKANREKGEVVAFQCQICLFSLSSRDDLKDHLSNHVKDSKEQADIYKQSRTLLEHLTHRDKSGKERKQNQCRYCKKIFITRTDLAEHIIKLHFGRTPWTCSYCPKSYTREYDLQRHEGNKHMEKIKSNSGSYRCLECPKRFTCRPYLVAHESSKHSN